MVIPRRPIHGLCTRGRLLALNLLLVALLVAPDPCLGVGHDASSGTSESPFESLGSQRPAMSGSENSSAAETASTLDCSAAIPLTLGGYYSGNTSGLPSQVDLYGCAPYPETGGEIVYRLDLPEPTRLEITIEAQADLDVIILGGCDPLTQCLALGDTGIRTVVPVTGSYYVVVDGYVGAQGPFVLHARTLFETDVAPAVCENAQTLEPVSYYPRDYEGSGTICSDDNQVDDLLCAYTSAPGSEVTFRVPVAASGRLYASAWAFEGDLVLWLLGGCGTSTECLAYADDDPVGRERILWSNLSDETRVVYIVVDQGTLSSGCRPFYLDVSVDIGVPVEARSWSVLKASYGGTAAKGGLR